MTSEPEGLGDFQFGITGQEEQDLLEPIVFKWFKVGPEGVEFHGYDAGEVIGILVQMSQMGSDAARWTGTDH